MLRLNRGSRSKETQVIHFFMRLRTACTKIFTTELVGVFGLWDLNKKKMEVTSSFGILSGVLQVKYDLNGTGMKK